MNKPRPLSRIEEEVLVSVAREYALADGTCSNPECPGRSGHEGPCWVSDPTGTKVP